jgi:hypothetical protein
MKDRKISVVRTAMQHFETRNSGIGHAPQATLGTFQGHRQTDRIGEVALRYADQKQVKVTPCKV